MNPKHASLYLQGLFEPLCRIRSICLICAISLIPNQVAATTTATTTDPVVRFHGSMGQNFWFALGVWYGSQ